MKMIYLPLLFSFAVCSATAENMVFRLSSGEEKAIPISEIGKITFRETGLNLHTSDAIEIFDFSALRSIIFGTAQGCVESVNRDNLKFYVSDGKIGVRGLADKEQMLLTDMSGKIILVNKHWDGSAIDITFLPKGAYILACGKSAFKFTR